MSNPYIGLKKIIGEYLQCTVKRVDIWDIEIICNDQGCIKKVTVDDKGKRQKGPFVTFRASTGEEVASRVFKRKLSNYCSIGIDARIGLGFDKSRSKNRIINKIVYAWEGFKKFIKPSTNMQTVIDRMEYLVEFERVDKGGSPRAGGSTPLRKREGGDTQASSSPLPVINQKVDGVDHEDSGVSERIINGYRVYTREIFQTSKTNRTLTINPINLIGLNIPSYMGGIQNMWDKADIHAPIKALGSEKVKYEKNQDMGDGEIEFLSFTGNLRFGVLERLLTGGGKRVAQGTGPFLISFKQSEDPVNKPLVTYAQVDGEYMQLVNPLFFKISLTPDLPQGKIHTLFKGVKG